MKHYILDVNNNPVASSEHDWAKWFATQNRVIRRTETDNGIVSTVFTGLASRNNGPFLWETLIMGGTMNGEMDRYSSHDDAVKGHWSYVKKILNQEG